MTTLVDAHTFRFVSRPARIALTVPARRKAIEDALLAYCKQDTWAMVEIARHLVNPAPGE